MEYSVPLPCLWICASSCLWPAPLEAGRRSRGDLPSGPNRRPFRQRGAFAPLLTCRLPPTRHWTLTLSCLVFRSLNYPRRHELYMMPHLATALPLATWSCAARPRGDRAGAGLTAATASRTCLPWWWSCAGSADLAVRASRTSWLTSSRRPLRALRASTEIVLTPACGNTAVSD